MKLVSGYMFCTNCGFDLAVEDNFCSQCGKAVRRIQNSEIVKPQTQPKSSVFEKPVFSDKREYTPPNNPSSDKKNETKTEKRREELRGDLKKLLEKEHGRDVTDQELFEAEHWLRNYAEVIANIAKSEYRRQEKLKMNPKGFALEGEGYSCCICRNSISKEETWYDNHGVKCLLCQSAIDKKIIPASAASNADSWYSLHDLEHSFFINRYGVKRFVQEGLLRPRIVPNSTGRPHYQLFFIKDHEGILPPKKLTNWPMVKVQKDGQDWYHSEPWFMYADPAEVLKGYKILDYLYTLKEKEVQKSFPELSFQIPIGARSFMKVNHIDPKRSEDNTEREIEA